MSIREVLKTGESTTNLKTTVTKTNLWDNPDHLDLKSKKSYWFFLRAWEICQVIRNLLRHWNQCTKQPTVSVPGTVLGNSVTGDSALSTDAGESPGLGDGRQTSESWLRPLTCPVALDKSLPLKGNRPSDHKGPCHSYNISAPALQDSCEGKNKSTVNIQHKSMVIEHIRLPWLV